MSYITLYRKYRPKTFSDVVGQDVNIEILKNSIMNDKIGHAYIFSGPRGTGKTSVAKIFSKAVNCENNKNGDLCGKCLSCKSDNESSMDIIEIDAASNNGVEEIREIRNNVKLLPSYSKYKVYIIDEVHMLSGSAFNALLKTLEEPPQHIIFILATTEINKVPATVLSRCQKFEFKKIQIKTIINRLKGILKKEEAYLSDEVLELIAKFSGGALRDAINLADQILSLKKENIIVDDVYDMVGEEPEETIYNLLECIIAGNLKEGISIIDKISERGRNFLLITERIQNFVRDIIIYYNSSTYFKKDYSNILDKFAKPDIAKYFKLMNSLFDLFSELKKPINQKELFETYFIKMIMIFEEIYETPKIKEETDAVLSQEKPALNEDENIISYEEKSITINNAIAEADLELKKEIIIKYSEIEEYISNKEFNSYAVLLQKSHPEVVSKRTILFSFKYNSDVIMFDKNIKEVQTFVKIIFGKKYSIVAVTEKEWEPLKKQYVKDIKEGKKFEFITEKSVTKKPSEIESIFGDSIVTIK